MGVDVVDVSDLYDGKVLFDVFVCVMGVEEVCVVCVDEDLI